MESNSENRLSGLLHTIAGVLENFSDCFYVLDSEWRFVYVNERAADLLGKSREFLEGNFIYKIFPESAGTVFESEYLRAVSQKVSVRFEAHYSPIDRWLSVSAHPYEGGLAVYFRDTTDRRKSQEALQASDARFRTMVENLPAGAVVREGDRLRLNSAAERITGYRQDEISTIGQWFLNLHPSDAEAARKNYEAIRASGFAKPQITTVTRKDGAVCHIEITPYADEMGELWLLSDVTDRIATEAKFRILFEYTNTPYFLFGKNGVSDCNASALQQLGFTDKAQAINRSFSSLSPERQPDGVLSMEHLASVNDELFQSGRSSFEWTHSRADGSLAHVFVSATKLKVGHESFELVVWQDLTHIKEAEDRLRQSEARYRTIIENTDEIIYTLSLEGVFTYVSPSWTRHLGHSVEEVLGRKFIDFVHPEDRRKGTMYTFRLFKDPSYRGSCVYRAVRKDGTLRWHETNGSVVMGSDGKALHFVGLSHDVTERLQARDALEEARDAALASSRAKSQFLATVSHEIRTPLNGVLGMTNLLADTHLSDVQQGFVKTIQSSGEILRRVIDDVLDYSRIEAGKLTISALAIDVISALQDVVSLFQGAAQEKGISLTLDCHGMKSLQVYADPARVKQVVANLVGNAVKFTEVGSVVVNVVLVKETATAMVLRIEVCDTGIGIKQDRAEAIFEGFTQADNSMHRRYGGSGLGLTISKRLTDLMGGAISVESQVGIGSKFWVELPLSKITRSNAKNVRAANNVSLQGVRVLLAEDNLINVEVAKMQIEKLGCVVEVAGTGREAVEMLEKSTYDIVLMDVQMPILDGLEATRQIRMREIDRGGHIPIIALTATAFAEDKKACEDAGMDGFLSKPFKRDELEELLKQWAPQSPKSSA